MFNVYFDNILQSEEDIINVNEIAEFTIIREDGFNSTEQILREKTEMELRFCGQAYVYVLNKLRTDKCAEIEFKIEDEDCGLQYIGTIPVTLVDLYVFEKYGTATIKDTSFSAYIRDVLDVDLFFGYTKTKECSDLPVIKKTINLYKNKSNTTDFNVVDSYDVLDAFKYIVNYFTDNSIDVVSTFLTTYKYAITTGFNMHNYAQSSEEIYPTLSFNRIFTEIRRKLRIYMGIEYYPDGSPYLRIEDEEYFFNTTTPLFSITDIQPQTVQRYDTNRDFSQILAGSNTTDLESGGSGEITYPQSRYTAWNEETYTGCGTCTVNKESQLDLTSDFIIDSNIIYEALNWGASDYGKDDNIFLYNYETISNVDLSLRTLDAGTGYYFYNSSLINENVLENWIDYYGKCLDVSRSAKYGFLVNSGVTNGINVPINLNAIGTAVSSNKINFANEIYDNENSVTEYTVSGDLCDVFVCAEGGTYNFRTNITNYGQTGIDCGSGYTDAITQGVVDVDYELMIKVYSDNTFVTLLDTYTETANAADAYLNKKTITLETGDITLSVGNCVLVEMKTSFATPNFFAYLGCAIYFGADSLSFELTRDDRSCISDEYNNQNSKPFEIEFQYPLCYSDYQLARNNNRGYITVHGALYWIKELTYRHKRLSTLKLMGNDTF